MMRVREASFRAYSSRKDTIAHILVRVVADGVVGWGECASPSDPYYCPETTETCWHLLKDFLGPLVFLDSAEKLTLPVGVALFQGSYASEYALTLAASVICTAPVLLIFFIFSKQIIRGISTAGLKD